jgi:hypothetical protein
VSGWQIQHSGMLTSEYLGTLPGLNLMTNPCTSTSLCPLPSIYVAANNRKVLLSTLRGGCLYARINRTPVGHQNIDFVLSIKDIAAIEVYRSVAEVPAEWKPDVWDLSPVFLADDLQAAKKAAEGEAKNMWSPPGVCGFLQIWTTAAY